MLTIADTHWSSGVWEICLFFRGIVRFVFMIILYNVRGAKHDMIQVMSK